MTLQEALNDIEKLGDDDVIFARKPWTLDTKAEVGHFDTGYRIPIEMASRGMEYFFEAHIAREEVLNGIKKYPLSDAERNALVIYYAEFEAFPEWLFERIRAFENENPGNFTPQGMQ